MTRVWGPRVGSRSPTRLCLTAAAAVAIQFALPAPPARANRLFIPQTHRSIQAAIDAARPGDTLWVAAGTYAGPFVVKKPLVLFGDAGAENTILDGGDSVRVLHVEGVKGAQVIGFTIRRGKANSGGGIHCVRDTSIMIAGCVFEKNWESGLSAWQSSDINVKENRFVENEGSALTLDRSSVFIQSCLFTKNRGYSGAAISFNHSKSMFPIRDCTFEENSADRATGGAVNADSSEITIVECVFKGNSAKLAGGAIAAMASSRVAVSRCRFVENHAAGSGAVHVDHASLNVALSIFDRNRALALGAAMGLLGRGRANINPIIQNNTFYKNTSEGAGASIWAEQVSPELRRNIFVVERGQSPAAGVSSSPLFECNLIHDPTGTALAKLPSSDTLVGDPLFCDAASGDFFLRDLSPAALARCAPVGALPKRCSTFKLVPTK